MKIASIWPLVALLGLSAIAQSPSSKDSAGEKPSQKTAADYPDEPYIYEYKRGVMRYENDGSGTRELQARMHVQTAAGLQTAGQLVFDYNAANEKLEIRSVKVIKADGKVIKASPEAVQDLSAPVAREAPLYTDAREKHVTVPGLAVGDTVEYEVVTTIQPLMAGQFWHNWNFIDTTICLDEQVELNVPRSRAVKIKSPSELEPAVREEGDRKIYHWATSNLRRPEPPDTFKNFKFDVETLLGQRRRPPGRTLMLSTFQSWEEVGAWYAQLEKDRRLVTPELRSRADAIVQGQTTGLGKATALYEWVSRNIRYVSLSFGVGRYQPHVAAEVLENRYGDCKDKSTLLDAFLEAEGIHSQTVLVNTEADVDSDLPSPFQFDHAINMVKIEGEERWLDSTLGVGPFGYLLPQLRGKKALVVFTDAAPALESSPSKLALTTLYAIQVKGGVTEQGKLDATLSLDIRGEWEVLMRQGILTIPPGQMDSLLQMFSQRANEGSKQDFSLSDFKNSDPTDISKPFHLQVRFSGTLKGEDLKSMKKDDLGSSTQEMVRVLTNRGSSSSDSLLALLPEHAGQLEGPKEYSLKLDFSLPLKSESKAKPMDVHITRDFADFQAATSWVDHSIHASWRLIVRVPEVPAAQAKEYAAFRKDIIASLVNWGGKPNKKSKHKDSIEVDLAPPAKVSPETLPPAVSALYTKAESAIQSQNWGYAEQNLESVVKEVPDFEDGWNHLGATRMALHKYAEAEVAFRKYVELAPDTSTPYLQLAYSLTAQEKYSQAAEVLEKDLARDPKDEQILRELGYVHLRLHQAEHAVQDLEKASSIAPNNAYGQYLLGSAYVDFDKHDKAASAFERAIALDSSARMLNQAAYRLAEGKTHLDRAESWSARSINQVEIELNQVTLQSIQTKTATLAASAASYWDTMGWIKFQKNDVPAAEKYIRAAWELSDSTTIGVHMARIYETQGKKDKAIETFAQVLALVPSTRTATDDEKDGRRRLGLLLGDESLVVARVNESKSRVKERRSIQIGNSAAAEGIAQYMVIVGPGSRLTDIQAIGPDNQLEPLTDAVRASVVPQDLPDDTIVKLPRIAILACVRSDQPCKFSLLSATDALRMVPAAPSADGRP
ncbi:MAG TPA: DUF3857 domain-containing protein [Candidatus Angelobacter sp.]